MIKISKTKLKGVLLIQPDIFKDHRGEYVEIYNEKLLKKNGVCVKFVEDDMSVAKKNVLRGIHGDKLTWKLISCLSGECFFVVVNCDCDSKDFGKWESFILSDKSRKQVLIPPKYGNGHFVLSEKVVFHYKQSAHYNPKRQFSYKWDDPKFNIKWPAKNPILSKRDELGYYV
ncbi:MAG: dTDP-4-dehydrorhamnose 3,5-epimerase family protein [Mobilitalea sp.]